MACALTPRKLKPGTFERFREAFTRVIRGRALTEGFVRFNRSRAGCETR